MLENYIGFSCSKLSGFYLSYSLNLFTCSYQNKIIKGFNQERTKDVSCFSINQFQEEESIEKSNSLIQKIEDKKKKKIFNNEAYQLPDFTDELKYMQLHFMFKYKSSDNEHRIHEEDYIGNLEYSFGLMKKFESNLDYKSENRYFKSEEYLKTFIQFCNINMVPVIASWCSNIKCIGIRCRVYDLVHIKNKCDEANKLLLELTLTKPNLQLNLSKIKNLRLEELKLLGAISVDIEQVYFERPKCNYVDIKNIKPYDSKLSDYKLNEAHINMNIFFYEEIRLHLFESDYFKGCKGVFYRPEQSYSVEYPNDIQIEANENLRKLAVNITKKNQGDSGLLANHANNMIKTGKYKLPNNKAKTMMNYFIKLNSNYARELENTVIDEKIQILINCIDLLVDLLYPFAELYANRFIKCYQITGFSTFDKNKQDPFQKIIESKCNNKYIKNLIRNIQISLPGYDSKLPRVVLEYGEKSFEHKLK